MVYITNKQKMLDFITNQIIPCIKNRDLDYQKTIAAICAETHSTINLAEEMLKTLIPTQIKEIHILTIPDEKVKTWLDEMKETDKEIKEAGL